MDYLKKYFLIVLFSGLLLIPFINSNTGFWEFDRKDENRVFTDLVQLDIYRLDKFPKHFESYLQDNFSFRTPLLSLYHHLKFTVLKVSPYPNRTVIGKEGWFFVSAEEKKIYEGVLDFNDEEIKAFTREWLDRKSKLKQMGIKMYWLISPMKHYVYEDYLPYTFFKSTKRRVEYITDEINKLDSNLVIDPSNELIKNREQANLFYKLDNHWSLQAGWITSQLVVKRLVKDLPEQTIPVVENIVWKDSICSAGIHYDVLGVNYLSEVRKYPTKLNYLDLEVDKYNFPLIEGFPYPWDYERRYINKDVPNKLKLLVIRDSFGDQVIPFLTQSFYESVFIFDDWQYNMNEDIIMEYQPDIVIYLSSEPLIRSIIDD